MEETPNVLQLDIVELYDGSTAPKAECSTFDLGVHAGKWYRNDDTNVFRLTSGDTCHKDADDDDIHHTHCGDSFHADEQEACDIVWVDWDECYAYSSDTFYGYVSRREEGYFIYEDHDYIECDNTYYRNSDVAAWHDVYYYDSVNEYRHVDDAPADDDDEDTDQYVNGYHSGSRRWRVDQNTAWTMGFEIEKEDYDAKVSCCYSDLPNYWTKEHDGSLDSRSGYELISPVYNLFDSLHLDDIAASDLLRQHINAKHSKACGGHIHIGSKLYSTEQIFEGISAFLPLLYALYESRISVNYCKAKKKHEYLNRDKYSAVYVRDTTVEFRIFPAVKSVDNLSWRVELLRLMIRNFGKSEIQVLRMLTDRKSMLHEHVAKVIGEDKMLSKINLFIKYSSIYNDADLGDEQTEIK